MVDLWSLWLPILVSSVALFILSFLAWMVLPHHKADWRGLPDEQAFREAIAPLALPPGNYMIPYCESSAEMKTPEFAQRLRAGPNGTLQLRDGPCNMSQNLVFQYLFFLGCSFCLAYLATLGVAPGESPAEVFRFVGTAGILTFTAASIPGSIWFNLRLWGYLIDGLMYGLAIGAIFALFWPGSAVAGG